MSRRTPDNEEMRIRQEDAEDYLIVLPSSISEHSGLGLYAVQDIPADVLLPYPYPGLTVPVGPIKRVKRHQRPPPNYDELNTYLARVSVEYDGDRNVPMIRPEIQEILATLRDRYRITVQNAVQNRERGTWTILDQSDPAVMIDWDSLYDHIRAYAFEIRTTGLQKYWPHYSHNGNLIFDPNDLENMALMANEPPPYNFVNLLTLKPQVSAVSVYAVERNGELYYKTLLPIEAGEEILICYGPYYNPMRHQYTINMSKTNGCGMKFFRDQHPGNRNADIKAFYKAIRKYEHDRDVHKVQNANVELFDRIRGQRGFAPRELTEPERVRRKQERAQIRKEAQERGLKRQLELNRQWRERQGASAVAPIVVTPTAPTSLRVKPTTVLTAPVVSGKNQPRQKPRASDLVAPIVVTPTAPTSLRVKPTTVLTAPAPAPVVRGEKQPLPPKRIRKALKHSDFFYE